MVKFKIPKFRRSKPTTTTPTPITLSERELRDLMDIINNPINHSLNEVTNAVDRLRLASYKINNISANVKRILASPNNFDIDNIKSAFLISMFVEGPRQPRLYIIYTSCLRTIFSRTAPNNIRDLWRFFDRNKGPNFDGYLRTKGVTELDVEAVIVVLISVFDRSLDEVQAALATLTKMGFDKLNEEIIHEAQEILDPSRWDHEIREIKIAVEILDWSKADFDRYIVGSDDIINHPGDHGITDVHRAFLILMYANKNNAREQYPIISRTLFRSFNLSEVDKIKQIWEFLKADAERQLNVVLGNRGTSVNVVEHIIEVITNVFGHSLEDVEKILGFLDNMGFEQLRLSTETTNKAVEILNERDVTKNPVEQVKIAFRILVWSNKPSPHIPIPTELENNAKITLNNLEFNSDEQVENAFEIISYLKQDEVVELFQIFGESFSKIFSVPDINSTKRLWKFFIDNGGINFKKYLEFLHVTETEIEYVIEVLGTIFEHTYNEVDSALKILKRKIRCNRISRNMSVKAREILNSDNIRDYTVVQLKIAVALIFWTLGTLSERSKAKYKARVGFEKYPEKVTTTQFVSRLKPLVAAFGNGVVNGQYMRTSGPTIKEITSAIITINGAHNIPNKEVKKAISVLKTVNIVLDTPNIEAQRVRLNNYKSFNPEQIKNIVSILEWNKVKIPLRFKGKINTWRDQLTRPDTINEVEDVLDILDKEWKYFIRINYVAGKLKKFADGHRTMKVRELGKSGKYLRELKWFESREQLWDSVDKLKGKVNDMLRLGIFDRHDIYDIESYLEQLKVDESKVIYDTGVNLNEAIIEKHTRPLMVDWKKVGIIARDIIKWSAAFVAVDQQLRDLIKRKGKKRTRGFK